MLWHLSGLLTCFTGLSVSIPLYAFQHTAQGLSHKPRSLVTCLTEPVHDVDIASRYAENLFSLLNVVFSETAFGLGFLTSKTGCKGLWRMLLLG